MGLSLFLNSLLEFYLSFGSEFLYNNLNPISILVLWFFLLFIFFVGIPYFRENEHTQKHRVRAKRRRKGGTRRGSRYYQSKDDDRELISFLKSTLGQNYDITRCRRLLCPDPSCEVCNNAAAEINQMLFSEALEKSTSSVSSVASSASETAPVTEPSFNQSSVFSAVPLGELLPTSLPEPSPQPPSVLSSNPMTTLGNFLSPSPLGQTPEPVRHSSPQPKDLFSSTLTQYDLHQGFLALRSTKTSFGADPEAKLIDTRHLLFLSPDEHDSAQEDIYPKTWKGNLKKQLTQLFWGLPSLHSESLSSAVNASGDYSIFFNSISNSFTDQESPGLSYCQPPFLAEVQPQPLSQTLPCLKPEHLHLTQIQTQAHLQSPLPILPSSPITENKVCEVNVHIPNYETECHTSSETEHLECNVLLKEQESLWGLTSVVQSSKAHVTNSIDPVEFPLSSEFLEKFENHLRKRLIQHHKGQPCRIHGSLSLMRPLSNCSGILESKSSSGLSWISVDKDQSNENPNVGLSQPGSFYERSLEIFQLEENKGKDGRPSQENDPKVHLLSDSKTSSHKDVGSGSEVMSLSRENSMFSEHSVSQRQLENVQKIHFLRKKFEKIGEGQLPGTVHSSQHSIKQNPVKSHTELEKRSLPSSVGGDYCLNTSQELPSLECGAQQMQKPHITKCQMRMLSALPTKVLESKQCFISKDTSSHSSINPNSSSSTKLISEANTKSGAFMPLRGSSESLHLDKVETGNSADDLNFPLPATSLVDKKGHSPADIQRTLSEEIQKFLKIKLPVTNIINGGESQIHPLIANIQPPKLPARREGTPQETKNNSVNSDRVEIPQGANREKSEPASRPSMSREIVRAEGLKALQLQTSGVLTTSKPGISQRIDKETIVTTENPPSKLPVKDPNLSELKTQIMTELKLKLETKYSEVESQPTDVSYDSDSLTCKGSLTPDQNVSSGDEEVPQLLHVPSEDSRVSMEKQQEPWLPRQALRSCQDQNSPPAVNNDTVCPPPEPTGPKSVELGAGDAQLTISQPEEKIFSSQKAVLEDILRNRSSQTLSQKGQATSLVSKEDTPFLGKIKNFFQQFQPGIKRKMQEALQEKGIIPLSSTQSRGPVKSRAAFTGPAHVMSDMGKSPEEKLGHRPAVVTTCPQEPLPSAVQSGKPVQKGAVQAQAEPVQRRPFLRRAPPYDMTNALSGRHTAILAGQGSTNTGHTTNEHRPPPNVVALKGQQISQKHPQSVPLRGTLPHPSPNCRPQIAKGPPAVLTTAGGTVFREQPPRFRHTMLLQNFQGETFPTPK